TGSDRAETAYLARVRAAGVRPALGHDAANVPAGDDVEVVVSTAIPASNPERAAARARGLRELHRGELLAEVTAQKRCLAVAGTHGKTTTTSMIAHALLAIGAQPAYLIGGELRTTGTNAAWGRGDWIVVEADESDRSFLRLRPEIAVVTNVELDHHTTYASRAEVDAAFAAFLGRARRRIVWDRPELLLLAGAGAEPFDAQDAELRPDGARFRFDGLEVRLAVPGLHNARNAAAALSAIRAAGEDVEAAAAALASFRGAGRRFEVLGRTPAGATVVDDYAHHPTEVAATIAAARTLRPRRVVALFQPHLYSRTRLLAREFGAALAAADVTAVLDVYPARERAADFPGVSGLAVAAAAADAAGGRPVLWLPGFDAAERALGGLLRDGDVLLVLGAGDVDALGRRLVTVPAA
ncbi:MAG TPA: cyanophycin synthetase, partial [Solirubrobacteraceae bacterium]|nr:cyanophycin synthetase [Solirubrobacteraceae bacterium]